VFGNKGPSIFLNQDDEQGLLVLLAVLNSAAFQYLLSLQVARVELAQSFEVGLVQRTPLPRQPPAIRDELLRLALRAWSLLRALDTRNETSHVFLLPSVPSEKIVGLDPTAIALELEEIQRKIDDHVFALYGIGPVDRAEIEASIKGSATISIGPSEDEGNEASGDRSRVTVPADTLLSWLVGVAFGRFDPRLAKGERSIPIASQPFDPLPSRSPGMWPETETRSIVPLDIMVDDPGQDDDIRTRVADAAGKAGVSEPEALRQLLAREFFALHIKMYSKSRRKAPIYWQLATPSASYSTWLYIHAFSKDTLFRVQNDYIAPKLSHEERRLEAMHREYREGATAVERKALATQEAYVEELRIFLAEVKRVAPLWNPNLDDGVIINFAPLWRLVPQYKPWQKEVKSTWDALCAGNYDWAHLAIHLWPERVVPKCAVDRSLAIAHDLEQVFWVQDADDKWTPRKIPIRSVEELVAERTSPSVKAALTSLLEAPTAPGGPGRGRRRRAAGADERGTR
jgi:hypothetical protein